jgi:hypothetical protein
MIEYASRYTSYASSAYAQVASGPASDVLTIWNDVTPFDNSPTGRGPLRGAVNPGGPVEITFESVNPPPASHDCVTERIEAIYLWTPRVVPAETVTPPAGWTRVATGPYGEAIPNLRGRGLIVLTPPDDFDGLTVTLLIETPVMRVRALTGILDTRTPVGEDDGGDDGGGDGPVS